MTVRTQSFSKAKRQTAKTGLVWVYFAEQTRVILG